MSKTNVNTVQNIGFDNNKISRQGNIFKFKDAKIENKTAQVTNKQQKVLGLMPNFSKTIQNIGLLPDATELAKYQKIHPHLVERIITIGEKEQHMRSENATKLLDLQKYAQDNKRRANEQAYYRQLTKMYLLSFGGITSLALILLLGIRDWRIITPVFVTYGFVPSLVKLIKKDQND